MLFLFIFIAEVNNSIELITEDRETSEDDVDTLPVCARINGVTDIESIVPAVDILIVPMGLAGKLKTLQLS